MVVKGYMYFKEHFLFSIPCTRVSVFFVDNVSGKIWLTSSVILMCQPEPHLSVEKNSFVPVDGKFE